MLSENSFPSLKESSTSNNDNVIPKPMMKYSEVLKRKSSNIDNSIKTNINLNKKETNNDNKTELLINTISEKTDKLNIIKSPIVSQVIKPQLQNNSNESHKSDNHNNDKNIGIEKQYQNNVDKIIKIQKWWRMVSKIKALETITNNKEKKEKDQSQNEEKKNKEQSRVIEKNKENNKKVKTLPKKPSFSDIVKLTPPSSPVSPVKQETATKKPNRKNKRNSTINNSKSSENKGKSNEKEDPNKKKVNEELNSILKNMKFMGLIEKEIDDLTEKNTIVNGKQFAKTKVVTIKKFSRTNSTSSSFSLENDVDAKKKGNKNENKTNNKKSLSKKKNVSFNEKDEVFNEYNHVMKKLDLHLRCDKKSCLIDCYRRLYKRDWEEEDEESSSVGGNSTSEGEENTESSISSSLKKKSDYSYNDIYNPNYTKYYSGSDFDFGNRYFTGKERLKKALHLEPVEVTVQKIIYQPMKYKKQNNRNQQKKKNSNKRKQK